MFQVIIPYGVFECTKPIKQSYYLACSVRKQADCPALPSRAVLPPALRAPGPRAAPVLSSAGRSGRSGRELLVVNTVPYFTTKSSAVTASRTGGRDAVDVHRVGDGTAGHLLDADHVQRHVTPELLHRIDDHVREERLVPTRGPTSHDLRRLVSDIRRMRMTPARGVPRNELAVERRLGPLDELVAHLAGLTGK